MKKLKKLIEVIKKEEVIKDANTQVKVFFLIFRDLSPLKSTI